MITNSREIRAIRKSLKLSQRQKLVLIGTLLGDGCLLPNSWGKNYRLSIRHGSSQKEYLFWKYKIFKDWSLSPPKYYAKTDCWYFRTISHPILTDFARKFYRNDRKIIPKDIERYLREPLVMAVWWMDDGNVRRDNGVLYGGMLNSQSFDWKDNLKLKVLLERIYRVKFLVIKDHNKPRLYISGKDDIKRFLSMIRPYSLPCLNHKFP